MSKNKTGQQIGYIRVSSVSQNDERQLKGVECDKLFREKVSGKDANRKELKNCIEYCRSGDTLNVHSMDRLARNLFDLQKIINALVEKGVKIHFHKENLVFNDSNNPFDKLLLQVMGAVSEFERNIIRERQKEGIENAKQKGKHLGRKKSLSSEDIKVLCEMNEKGIHKTEISKHFNISRQSVYTYLKGAA